MPANMDGSKLFITGGPAVVAFYDDGTTPTGATGASGASPFNGMPKLIVAQGKPKKQTPATVILQDDLDPVQGQGRALSVKLVDAAKKADLLILVVRGFENPTVIHHLVDNDAIREISARALRRRGYTVFEARNAEEAIDWTLKGTSRPDILITDVVMPGLSGPNLAARLLQQNPKLRVLYMSGYTDDATEVHGTFWGGVPLLQKPFTPAQLAERVRMAPDATAGS